jgi:hypothetical protein
MFPVKILLGYRAAFQPSLPQPGTSGRQSKFDTFVLEIGETIETEKLRVVAPVELPRKINE